MEMQNRSSIGSDTGKISSVVQAVDYKHQKMSKEHPYYQAFLR
jgi:hypothetical protein